MRKRVGTFRYPVELGDAQAQRFEQVMPWVDTWALYSQFPASLLERLGHRPNATRRFRLADGSTMERPIGDVPMRISAEVRNVVCIYAGEDADSLLGATALEAFSMVADPVNETLNTTIALLLRGDV